MLRDFHIHIQEPQIEALAILAAVTGSAIYTSDPIHEMGESRRKLLDLILPSGQPVDARYPEWQSMKDLRLIVTKAESGTLVYWFNPTNNEYFATPDWKELAGADADYVWQYHGTSHKICEVPYVRVAPRTGQLFFVSNQELESEPGNLWKW